MIKLLEFDVNEQSLFLNDINEAHAGDDNYISSNISKIDTDILKAWKLIQDARPNLKYRKDWAVLQETKTILSHSKVLTVLGEVDGLTLIIQKNTSAPCAVCDKNNLNYIMLNNYLNYVDYFATNYANATKKGYEKVLGAQGIKSNGIHQVAATAFVLRVLKENSGYTSTISSFEEKIEPVDDDGNTNRAFADIVESNNKIIECKSWEINGIAFQNFIKDDTELRGSTKQFATYLSDVAKITSMDKIEYWFDKMKLGNSTDPTQVKEKFKQMMYNGKALTKKGELIFEVIWGNSALRGSLWNDIPANTDDEDKSIYNAKFKDIVSNTSNIFYNFIQVK